MATTAKLNSQGNYEIFKDGQRVATGTESVLSQYGLSPTSLTNEATTPSGQKINPVTGQIITSDTLGQTPIPFVSPEVSPPSDISGLPIAEIKLTPQEEAQTSLEKQMADLAISISGKPAFEAEKRKEFGIEAAQQAYDDLNTQLRDLQRQQQLVPLAIQREAEGRGRTEGGVEPLEIGKRRALAYDALTTSSLIDAAQGRLASAERKVTEAVNNKFAPDEAKYAALLNNLNLIKNSPTTSIQDKNRAIKQEEIIKARQGANEKAKEEAKNILSWANKAAENMAKQGNLDTVILNKIANSKTESEAFSLAAPFLATPAAPKTETGDIADFKTFFPKADLATPEGQKLYFDWKAKGQKPTVRDTEIGGRIIREVIDPMTGKTTSRTDLGAKEKPKEPPTSYQEWQLAGSPGTYEGWVKKESVVDVRQRKQNLADLLGQVASYNNREEALSELNKYQSSMIVKVGEEGISQLKTEIDRLFPEVKEKVGEKAGETTGLFGSFFKRLFGK